MCVDILIINRRLNEPHFCGLTTKAQFTNTYKEKLVELFNFLSAEINIPPKRLKKHTSS